MHGSFLKPKDNHIDFEDVDAFARYVQAQGARGVFRGAVEVLGDLKPLKKDVSRFWSSSRNALDGCFLLNQPKSIALLEVLVDSKKD